MIIALAIFCYSYTVLVQRNGGSGEALGRGTPMWRSGRGTPMWRSGRPTPMSGSGSGRGTPMSAPPPPPASPTHSREPQQEFLSQCPRISSTSFGSSTSSTSSPSPGNTDLPEQNTSHFSQPVCKICQFPLMLHFSDAGQRR